MSFAVWNLKAFSTKIPYLLIQFQKVWVSNISGSINIDISPLTVTKENHNYLDREIYAEPFKIEWGLFGQKKLIWLGISELSPEQSDWDAQPNSALPSLPSLPCSSCKCHTGKETCNRKNWLFSKISWMVIVSISKNRILYSNFEFKFPK